MLQMTEKETPKNEPMFDSIDVVSPNVLVDVGNLVKATSVVIDFFHQVNSWFFIINIFIINSQCDFNYLFVFSFHDSWSSFFALTDLLVIDFSVPGICSNGCRNVIYSYLLLPCFYS